MKHFFTLFFAAALSVSGVCTEYLPVPRKKIINYSWSSKISTEELKLRIAELEAVSPYDGTAFRVNYRTPEGKVYSSSRMFGTVPWKYEFYQQALSDLKETKFRRFTDNFLSVANRPGNMDYFSDAAWSVVCNNFRLAARFCKEAKVKGFLLDLEEYGEKIWDSDRFPQHSIEELHAKARQRGREFGRAIFDEYPGITLFCVKWLCDVRDNFTNPARGRNLMAPFINGMYDVMPDTVKVVLGHERHGYVAQSPEEIFRLRNDFLNAFPAVVAPENLRKYRAQTTLAVPFYLDSYFGPQRGKPYYRNALRPAFDETAPLELYKRNLRAALEVSDEYVWLWSEMVAWYQVRATEKQKIFLLEKEIPGITGWTRLMTDPEGYAKQKGVPGKELLKNGTFSAWTKGKLPREWKFWQRGKTGSVKPGANGGVQLCEVRDGSLFQELPVREGQCFRIRLRAKTSGSARIFVSAGFLRKSGQAFWHGYNFGKELVSRRKDGTLEDELYVIVPKDAVKMRVFGSMRSGRNGAEAELLSASLQELAPAKVK